MSCLGLRPGAAARRARLPIDRTTRAPPPHGRRHDAFLTEHLHLLGRGSGMLAVVSSAAAPHPSSRACSLLRHAGGPRQPPSPLGAAPPLPPRRHQPPRALIPPSP